MYRNAVIRVAYVFVLKPIFFLADPERVHDRMVGVGKFLGEFALTRRVTHVLFDFSDWRLEQNILGIHFKNPVGLAAGFDKNADLLSIVSSVGFGFAEVGSITGEPCAGNPKPRLWRLPKSQSLAGHYGLKNDGASCIYHRVANRLRTVPVGTNIAMTNCRDTIDIHNAIRDYAKSFRIFAERDSGGSYFTVNVSCPNTLGGQPFMDPDNLDLLLAELDAIQTVKPVFIKLSPDVSLETVDQILDIAHSHRIHGIICTNLTKKRDSQKILDAYVPAIGGLSGKLVQDASDALLAHIYSQEHRQGSSNKNHFVLIGLGGVFTALDAYKKIRLGANLVQLITGMIFEGPQSVSEINRGLASLLIRDGFQSINEVVGIDNPGSRV